ncbi:hypothetical protein FDH01_gp263 [Acinetobacter phage vB_AbaM_ME3]|uniref:Uncharacterized protein n=1 Tax=Acinetobacter phage vB_AbaM_ME3 TaxID=1837876 RepID=A0A172Q0P0_9CAUD|nr:hypothetical protein FDH01_gp263 [Acinetobacter phage vB_AbaM_ME3]AND75359.1 hypothetical protein ME3_198 [Acinetobacter phage vB_AbaM_ME3]
MSNKNSIWNDEPVAIPNFKNVSNDMKDIFQKQIKLFVNMQAEEDTLDQIKQNENHIEIS